MKLNLYLLCSFVPFQLFHEIIWELLNLTSIGGGSRQPRLGLGTWSHLVRLRKRRLRCIPKILLLFPRYRWNLQLPILVPVINLKLLDKSCVDALVDDLVGRIDVEGAAHPSVRWEHLEDGGTGNLLRYQVI